MNKVKERSLTEGALKFKYASESNYSLAKWLKLGLYFLAIIPVIMSVIPALKEFAFAASIVSFSITIISDLTSQLQSNIVEFGILEKQLFEIEITGSTFSKIEYDREMTNKLHELAIRKGDAKAKSNFKHVPVIVPDDISDDYSYLYIVRTEAASTNYLLSRMFYFWVVLLIVIIGLFFGLAIIENDTTAYLTLIIGFYPLLKPIINNITSSKKAQTNYVKICADIDNFFADGDASLERLARFYYYVQNLEFEALKNRPVMYNTLTNPFKKGKNILVRGVTERFKEAIYELKTRNLMLQKGLAIPKAHDLITKRSYSLEELERRALRKASYQNQVKKIDLSKSKTISKGIENKTIKDTAKTTVKVNTEKSSATPKTTGSTKTKTSTTTKPKSTTVKTSTASKPKTSTKSKSTSTKKATKK